MVETLRQIWSGSVLDLSTRATIFGPVFLCYLGVVRVLRFRRSKVVIAKLGMHSRSDYASLTVDQAQEILQGLAEWEFSKIFSASVLFALIRIHDVPSVSRLLVSTSELVDIERISERTADTGVLVLEFCINRPSSQRSKEAIVRMNSSYEQYIHRKEVSKADMLYTLSLFALEPVRFLQPYEWRPMNELERCAAGTFWKAMGEELNLDYSKVVPRFEGDFTDGLTF